MGAAFDRVDFAAEGTSDVLDWRKREGISFCNIVLYRLHAGTSIGILQMETTEDDSTVFEDGTSSGAVGPNNVEMPSCDSQPEPNFARPFLILPVDEVNRLRLLSESTEAEVPASFQRAWTLLLTERRGNVGVLDGFVFVADVLMGEEGFHKMPAPEDEEKETLSIRRSYYSHLLLDASTPYSVDNYSCLLIFSSSKNGQKIVVQSSVRSDFRRAMNRGEQLPSYSCPISTRYWIRHTFGGQLRSTARDMFRNLAELARDLKDQLVFKLQAIVAHGLQPPVLLGIESLPSEVLEMISFACRKHVETIMHLGASCRRLLQVTSNDILWRSIARATYPQFRAMSDDDVRQNHGSWRQVILAEYKTCRAARLMRANRRQYVPMGTGMVPMIFPIHPPYLQPPPPLPHLHFPPLPGAPALPHFPAVNYDGFDDDFL